VTRSRPAVIAKSRIAVISVSGGDILLWQRPDDSQKLAGFWELPEPEHLEIMPQWEAIGRFRHSITNHIFTFEVVVARTPMSVACKEVVNCAWVSRNSLKNMALSTTARKALHLYDLYLSKTSVERKNESIDPNPDSEGGRSPGSNSRDHLGA
jgi:adenine-specific DNA glycosylase